MKKKGFTLIELLAVIVILAIITIIAVPKILDVIDKSRKQTFTDGVKLIESGIKTQLSSSGLTGESSFTKGDDNCYLFDFTNKNNNYNELKVKNKENYSGEIKYCDNKFTYIEFDDGSYVLNRDEEGIDYISKIGAVKTYIVIFDTDGGKEKIENQTIEKNGIVTKPQIEPTKEGYVFVKWTLNGKDYNFSDKVKSNMTLKAVWEKQKLCKRATTLHTGECTASDSTRYCSGSGYTSGNKGTTITYGNLGTSGILASGDAFDCDVNGDGTYNSETERFYYVSDYYNTNTKAFESDTAVLIYYTNVNKGEPSTTATIAYDSSGKNNNGPVTVIEDLPTTSQWSNVKLKNDIRRILTMSGETSTTAGELPSNFSYSGKAARLITAQEINSGCNITLGNRVPGEIDTCNYLMEHTTYEDNIDNRGTWTESPYSDSSQTFHVNGYRRYVDVEYASNTQYAGARPVIDVAKSNISY